MGCVEFLQGIKSLTGRGVLRKAERIAGPSADNIEASSPTTGLSAIEINPMAKLAHPLEIDAAIRQIR